MTRGSPSALRAALLASIGLFAFESRQWPATGVLVAVWLAGLTPLRIDADRLLQLALGLIAIAASWFLSTFAGLPLEARTVDGLGPIGQLVSLAFLLAASTRLLLKDPWARARASAGLVLLALLFLADGQFDASFIATSVLVLLCLWRALWAEDPARTGWRSMDARLRSQTLIACTIAGCVALGMSLAIPAVYPWLSGLVLNAFDDPGPATGFSSTLTLGDLSGLGNNDTRVLRLHGKYVEHLRGISYDEYHYGGWIQSKSELHPVVLKSHAQRFSNEVETLGGDTTRYFVPLQAAALAVEGDSARVDDGGNLHTLPTQHADRIRFDLATRDALVPAAPDAHDLQIPSAIAPTLRSLAREWTAGVSGSSARLAALSDHLRSHYTYALELRRSKGVDPVIDFLTLHRHGHCEYFASALALLARSLDIPARVIGGYRVAEHNDLGNYYVVREQHAHAWVEAWQPETGWQTYDATPASALPNPNAHTPLLASVFDAAGHFLSSLTHRLTTRDLYVLAGLLLVALFVVRVVQSFRNRSARTTRRDESRAVPLALTQLLDALERHGHPRSPDEPLERYASRISETPALAPCAEALQTYGAHRYGHHGSLQQVEQTLTHATAILRPR